MDPTPITDSVGSGVASGFLDLGVAGAALFVVLIGLVVLYRFGLKLLDNFQTQASTHRDFADGVLKEMREDRTTLRQEFSADRTAMREEFAAMREEHRGAIREMGDRNERALEGVNSRIDGLAEIIRSGSDRT